MYLLTLKYAKGHLARKKGQTNNFDETNLQSETKQTT